MIVPTNNSAGRLHRILCNLRGAKPNANRALDAWRIALDIKQDEDRYVHVKITELWRLVDESKAQLNQIGGDHQKLYLDSFPVVERILSLDSVVGQWGPLHKLLQDPSTLQGLAFCAVRLSEYVPEGELEENEIAAIINSIESLANSVINSTTLPESLRSIINTHLSALRDSLIDYKLFGIKNVHQSLDSGFGSLCRESELYRNAKDSDPEIILEYEKILTTVDNKVSALCNIKKLGSKTASVISKIGTLLPD